MIHILRQAKRSYEMDMCSGKIMPKLLSLVFPIILTNCLQLFYNATDVIVVGRFAGSASLAAVGSTGSVTGLLVNFLMGFSIGAGVVTSQNYGAKDYKNVSSAVHTSVVLSIVGSIVMGALGFFFCRPLLRLMGSPPDVIDKSVLYLRIIFAGLPFSALFNFGSAVLRSVGDTKRPLCYLTLSGFINVGLNLVFVICLKMDVAGVAAATIISQAVSAALVILCLIRSDGCYRLCLRNLRADRHMLGRIIRIGLPAGLQSSIFSVSNMLIQSGVNSFDTIAIAGNSASQSIENFVAVSQGAIHQGAIAFTGQNVGRGKFDRISKICKSCVLFQLAVGAFFAVTGYILGPFLLSVYDTNPDVIAFGLVRLRIMVPTFMLCGMMDVMVGMLRGMGRSFTPMLVSIIGVCVLRVIWMYTVFPAFKTPESIFISYPVSWIITGTAQFICYLFVRARLIKSAANKNTEV